MSAESDIQKQKTVISSRPDLRPAPNKIRGQKPEFGYPLPPCIPADRLM